jgi:hypothetical protein
MGDRVDDTRDTMPCPPPSDDVVLTVAMSASGYVWMHCCENAQCTNEADGYENKPCTCQCELCVLAEVARMGMAQVNAAKAKWARIVMDRRNK